MTEFHRQFEAYIRLAHQHPERALIGAFSRSIIFEITDGEDFVMEIRDGEIAVEPGRKGLDWRGKDWQVASCMHTTEEVLLEIVRGETLPTEAFILERLGWGSRGLADLQTSSRTIYRWVCQIFRLASEEADRQGRVDLLQGIFAPTEASA